MKTKDAWENSECYQKLLYILSVLLYGSVLNYFIRNSIFKCEIRWFLHITNSTRPLLHQLFWTDITNVKPNPDDLEWGEQEKKSYLFLSSKLLILIQNPSAYFMVQHNSSEFDNLVDLDNSISQKKSTYLYSKTT